MTYKCEHCGDEFEGAWSDEEAMQESMELFGYIPSEDRVVICDDCFKELRVKERRLEEIASSN
jgi:DNA-directed RNA polymerase subunit RPC12/RpoP